MVSCILGCNAIFYFIIWALLLLVLAIACHLVAFVGGCRLNEEMIETLFVCNPTNLTPKEMTRRMVLPSPNQENTVLDPKKSQNIAILLRALNVTKEEVCEALLEGENFDLASDKTVLWLLVLVSLILLLS